MIFSRSIKRDEELDRVLFEGEKSFRVSLMFVTPSKFSLNDNSSPFHLPLQIFEGLLPFLQADRRLRNALLVRRRVVHHLDDQQYLCRGSLMLRQVVQMCSIACIQ